jgi:hypothetical protein
MLLALGSPLAAQVAGVPVAAGGLPRGVTVEALAGFPEEAGDVWAGALGGRAGRWGATATVASVPEGDGRALGWGVLGEALVVHDATSPFQVLAFAGVGNRPDEWRVPVGASLGFRVPLPLVTIVPWLAPRLQYADRDGGTDGWDGALGGGLDVRLGSGLGVRAAYDIIFLEGRDERTFGLGLSWTFDPGS